MFFQPPDEEPNCSQNTFKTFQSKTQSRRQKKLRRKNKLKAIKKLQIAAKTKTRTPVPIFPNTMSSWAEDFTKAATWQLKHEVAFWKSKALALEYENKILHRTIRINSNEEKARKKHIHFESDFLESSDLPDSDEEEEGTSLAERCSSEEFVVSEEYIQFLRDNQVYRDYAKKERERMKAEHDAEKSRIEAMEAGPTEDAEDHQQTLKNLYGDSWQRISALEMKLKTEFISICDQDKPTYWPNIPFNFNFR